MNARQKAAESVKNNGILPGSIKLPVDFEDIPFSSSGVSESDEIRLMLKNRVECPGLNPQAHGFFGKLSRKIFGSEVMPVVVQQSELDIAMVKIIDELYFTVQEGKEIEERLLLAQVKLLKLQNSFDKEEMS